ncbi:uncharacterized protein [Maniola hyperantus]|uniref:uncharacterized protein n=1 Tax=Aphantopus hyperantus TaxID=2795564 RepID=UPI00374A24A6
MAFNKQKGMNFIIVLLTTAFIVVPVIATTNDDCKGKPFYCVNSTHFKICVDFGGVSKTVDDFLIQCPPGTACTDSNYFECEYHIPTTSAPVAVQSDVTNELSETTVSSPWELFEVTTFHPISSNERSIELLENSTKALPETVSEATGTETATIVSDTPVNDVQNEVITVSENKTTISDLSISENNSNYSKPTELFINNNITSPITPDGTIDLSGDNLSATISYEVVSIENYTTTESAKSIDLFNTFITAPSNTVKAADFTSAKLFNSVIIDSLSVNNLSAAVTTQNYSGTESEISIDVYEPLITTLPNIEIADNPLTTLSSPVKTDDFRLNSSLAEVVTEKYSVIEKDLSVVLTVITTPSNTIGNEDFTSTTLSPSMKSDDSILKSSFTAVPTENYSAIESETLVTSSNNKVNTHFTTVTLSSPVTTESLINSQNSEISLTVTSDSYLPNTQQDTTERDNNFVIESATNTNEVYTNAVKKTFHDRVDDYPMHENSNQPNKIYEVSSSSQNFDLNHMGFLSTTAENLVLRNTLEGSSINEQTELSSPVITADSVNAKNIRTLSDIVDSANITSLHVEKTQQTTVTHFGQTTTEANMLYTNAPSNEKNIILNKDDTSTTKLYATVYNSQSTTEDIVNSSPDVSLTTISDSYVVDAQKDTAERDINSPTLTTSTTKDVYTNPEKSISQVDETSMHENGSSVLPNSDFLTTFGYDESHSTTTITVVSKNTEEKISPKEQSDIISLQINKSYPFNDKVNKELLETTTIQSTSVIDFTTNTDSYYEVNLSITSTVNENEFNTNVAKKSSKNTTVELSRNGTHKNIIDEITTYLPQNTDFTSSAKTDNIEVSFTTAMNAPLNDTVERIDLAITTESYVATTKKHMNLTEVELPIFPTIDVTTQYLPTTQNIVTETLTNEFYSTVTKDDYGSTQDFTIQQNSNDNIPSMFSSFPKHNDSLIELSVNASEPIVGFEVYEQTTKADTDLSKTQASNYGSLKPTTATTEKLINVEELSRTESNNKMYDSFNFTTILINTTRIANKEQPTDPINGILIATSVTKSWDTMNDTVQAFLSLNTTPKVTVDYGITPSEFKNKATTTKIQQNVNDNTHSMFLSFPKHDYNLIELSINVSEPIVAFEVYEQTSKADTDLSKTASYYGSLRPTTASTETLINVKELSRNESNNKMYDSSNFTTILINNTTRTADKEQTVDPINEVRTATSVTKSWDTMNDTVHTLNAAAKVTVDNEITPSGFKNQPTTANYVFDYEITTHAFITDGIEVSSNVSKGSIAKTTLENENKFLSTTVSVPKPSALTNDNFNIDVINDIYGSTSPSNPMIENYSFKKYLAENVTESSMSELDNLEIPQIINSTAFAEANKSTIHNMGVTETDKSSINFNIIDKLSVNTENSLTRPSVNLVHSLNITIDKDRNNIMPTFETNLYQISTQTLLKNTFANTERTIPIKSTNNPLKSITAQLSESYFLLNNNTQLDIENENITKENVIKLLNATKSDSLSTSKINVTNENPVNTAIYRNVNSSIQSHNGILKVTELDTNKISADDTTADIGPPITENNLRPNIGYVNNATINKNISAHINKNINTTDEESTIRDSVMSSGLNVQDTVVKMVSLLNHHLQNTSINSNKSTQLHTNQNIDNFTKQFNNSRFISVVNTDENLYKHIVKNISFNIPEKIQYQTLNTDNESIVNLNNLTMNLETRHAQNNSYKIVPHKTRKDDTYTLHINAENKQIINTPMLTNEDKRKEHNITRITPVELNNKNLPNDFESRKSEFNCYSRHRGKYSDKNDCQNFYICIGRSAPIFGKCPNKTVFSEISKQCTKNLSHCIRNNQFQCTSEGRYIDIFSDQFYYICAKKVEGYIRFKLQCQKGYHLDKTKLKCILDSINVSKSNEDSSSKTDSEKSTIESKSKEHKDSKNQTKNFDCKKEGKFVYPDNCRKYYQCTKCGKSGFRRKIKKCDSDEVFNHEKRTCVDDDSSECKD